MLALIFLLLVQLQLAPLVHSQLLGRSNNPLFNGTVATERTTVTFTPKGASKPVEITGLRGGGFDLFQGVPFAKPPVGPLRWAHPEAAVYNDTFDATQPPAACMQSYSSNGLVDSNPMSEDCLSVNILSPAGLAGNADAKLPVFVWIYGGGFTTGAGSYYVSPYFVSYGAQTNRPFILVTLNYRVGVLGFLTGKESAANGAVNLGLRDQLLALQWVQDNIGAFGGDPARVTLAGQSAGAISIALHYLNTDAVGTGNETKLFQNAIMQSGAQSTIPLGLPGAEMRQNIYDDIAKEAGCKSKNATTTNSTEPDQESWKCMLELPIEILQNASQKVQDVPANMGFIFSPAIDGDLVPESPRQLLLDGKFANIPFISSSTKDEGTLVIPSYFPPLPLSVYYSILIPGPAPSASLLSKLQAQYPDIPSLGCPFDTGNNTFNMTGSFKQMAAIVSDGMFQSRRRFFLKQANLHNNTKTWTYQFEVGAPDVPAYKGFTHGIDIMYSFGGSSIARGYTGDEVDIGEGLMNYFLNFLYYNDPNGAPEGEQTSSSTVNVAVPEITFQTTGNQTIRTNWPTYGSPDTLNSLHFLVGNTTVIQDTFRWARMAIFENEDTAAALLYKREDDE